MGKRKVNILEEAATSVAEIAFFIEGKGMPATAKKFVDEVFDFFDAISIDTADNRICTYLRWKDLGYNVLITRKNMLWHF